MLSSNLKTYKKLRLLLKRAMMISRSWINVLKQISPLLDRLRMAQRTEEVVVHNRNPIDAIEVVVLGEGERKAKSRVEGSSATLPCQQATACPSCIGTLRGSPLLKKKDFLLRISATREKERCGQVAKEAMWFC